MHRLPQPTLSVPSDWSPEQVLAVLDFLEDLHAAIWLAYEDPIEAALLAEPRDEDVDRDQPPAPNRGDNDPF